MMHRTKTWIVLYALGIAMLALSLCQSEDRKPVETPRPPASVSQGGVALHSGIAAETIRQ
jgi:hypothetical protein